MTTSIWQVYLGSTFCTLFFAKANKHRVSHFDKDVVHTVHVNVFNAPLFHILKDAPLFERQVQTSIAVRCSRELVTVRENHPPIKVQARKCALLKDYHIGRVQPKVLVLFEVVHGAVLGVLTGHYVPGGGEGVWKEEEEEGLTNT